MKVVVTGGAGFIGSHIVDAFVTRGCHVHSIDSHAAGIRPDRLNPKAQYHNVDIRDYERIAPIMREVDYVFHQAALPRVQFSIEHPLETFAVNVDGTAVVLKAAHEGGAKRFIFASSGGSVYGDQEVQPFVETMQPRPKSPYGLQKYMGELMCRMWSDVYGMSCVSLRYFNVYGPRMDPEGAYALVVPKFLKQRKNGQKLTIRGDGSHTRDYTHVRDIVNANILAAESGAVGHGEAINIGAGRPTSVKELASLIGGEVEYVPDVLEPAHAFSDSTLARQLLGWQPTVKIEDGIAELKKEFGIV